MQHYRIDDSKSEWGAVLGAYDAGGGYTRAEGANEGLYIPSSPPQFRRPQSSHGSSPDEDGLKLLR